MNDDLSNQYRTRLELQQLRRNSSLGDSVVIGYEDEFGVSRSASGDDDAPFAKMVPFPSEPAPWATFVPLPDVNGEYVFTPAIDVAKSRTLAIWLDYVPAAGGEGPLSIVAEAARTLNAPQDFFPVAVLDGTLTAVTPPGAVFPPLLGSRTFYPGEFRTAAPIGAVSHPNRSVVPFDVSAYVAFRLGVIDLSDGGPGALTLFYSRAS